MTYIEHKDNPKSFRALTGLNHAPFSSLLPHFEDAHDDYLFVYEMNGKRRSNRRRSCIYKNSPLPTVVERLFFILVYLKNNLLQEYHAACFGMDQKHCNTFVHCLTHILRLGLTAMKLVPAETDKNFLSGCVNSPNRMLRLYCFMMALSAKSPVRWTTMNKKRCIAERRNDIRSRMPS